MQGVSQHDISPLHYQNVEHKVFPVQNFVALHYFWMESFKKSLSSLPTGVS